MTTLKLLLCATTAIPACALGAPPQQCIGAACCPDSSCYPLPLMGCRATRGKTKCVGHSVLGMKPGVCQCTGAGGCSSSGTCSAITPSSHLYEVPHESKHFFEVKDNAHEKMAPVPPERINPVRGVLALVGVGMIFIGVMLLGCGTKRPQQAREASRPSRSSRADSESETELSFAT